VVGGAKINRDAELCQLPVERSAHHPPFKASLTATERRHSQRSDAPCLVVTAEIFQAGLDVGEPRGGQIGRLVVTYLRVRDGGRALDGA
jgi:hypothetical protein